MSELNKIKFKVFNLMVKMLNYQRDDFLNLYKTLRNL